MWPPPDPWDGHTGELCGVCLRMLVWSDAYVWAEHLTNTAEMGGEGGSYLVGNRCLDHAPTDAVPAHLLDQPSTVP